MGARTLAALRVRRRSSGGIGTNAGDLTQGDNKQAYYLDNPAACSSDMSFPHGPRVQSELIAGSVNRKQRRSIAAGSSRSRVALAEVDDTARHQPVALEDLVIVLDAGFIRRRRLGLS
jgi:hypothetical protein